jgi:hypothetical protein
VKRLIDFHKTRVVPFLILLNLAITIPLAYKLNIWGDEAYTLHTTGGPLSYAFEQAIHFELQAPLYYLLLSLWRKLSGAIFWARLFSVACIIATIKLGASLSRRFFKEIHAGWLTALLAFHPFLIWAAVDIRAYALVILLSAFLLLLFFDGFLSDESGAGRARLLYTIVSVLALYTHYYLGFLLLAAAAALLVLRRWRALRAYLLAMAAVFLCFAPMIPIVLEQMRVNTREVAKPASLTESVKVISWRAQEYVLPAEAEPLQFARRWILRLGLAGALALLLTRRRKSITAGHVAVWTIFAVLCFLYTVALFLTEEGLMQARHTAGLFLVTLLFIFSVITALGSRRILTAWALLCALFYGLFLYTFYRPLAKPGDWLRVASFISASEKEHQPILVFRADGALPLRFYYTGANMVVALPAEQRFVRFDQRDEVLHDEEEIRRALRERAGGDGEELWLVTDETCRYFEIDFHCEVLEDFVGRNYETVSEQKFYGSRVRLLRRRPDR